jgi:hypothetical protein
VSVTSEAARNLETAFAVRPKRKRPTPAPQIMAAALQALDGRCLAGSLQSGETGPGGDRASPPNPEASGWRLCALRRRKRLRDARNHVPVPASRRKRHVTRVTGEEV